MLALLDRHFWFLALGVTVVAAYRLQARYTPLGAARPELAAGYERFQTWFVGLSGGLWILMGVGIIAGGATGLSAFLRPATGNLWVLLWHAALVGMALAGAVWIFLRGGSDFVEQHPGLIGDRPLSAAQVRARYGTFLAALLLIELLLWRGRFPA